MEAQKKPFIYPSGFHVGQRVVIHGGSPGFGGPRKYNTHIFFEDYERATVVEPVNPDTFPADAVDVRTDGNGQGAVDSWMLTPID